MPKGVYIRTEENKRNISQAMKRYDSEHPEVVSARLARLSNPSIVEKAINNSRLACLGRTGTMLGKHLSDESKKKISNYKKGNKIWFGRKHKEESKDKIRISKLGSRHTEETKIKIGINSRGNKYGLGYHHTEEAKDKIRMCQLGNKINLGRKHTDETNRKISESLKGNRFAYGHRWTDSQKQMFSDKRKGKTHSETTRQKMRENNPHYWSGKKHSIETRLLWSKNRKLDKHPNWKGGISYEPYTKEFNRQIKELIRDRDNHICQKCGIPETELIRKLTIHHIDYLKYNCLPTNLISLCISCNSIVNQNRPYWTRYFTNLLNRRTLKPAGVSI